MAQVPIAIVVAIFMALCLSVAGEKKVVNKRQTFQIVHSEDVFSWLCQNNPLAASFDFCRTTTTTKPPKTTERVTTATTPESTSVSVSSSPSTETTTESKAPTTTEAATPSTSSLTPLERAHWCRFSNGTYLPLGETFTQMKCLICQCKESHDIVCSSVTCMATYCIDNTTPKIKDGDCCPTCVYEEKPASCKQNGIIFPHGTVIKVLEQNLQCWCQSGTIECRKTITTTVYTSWEFWGRNTTVYVVVVIIFAVLLLGTLFCCGCALLYYYYYQNQQQSIQQAYEQYYNNAGWQPMTDEENVNGASAEEKKAEAEQNQFEHNYPTGQSPEFIPPPYAVYNGSYVNEESGKDEKHV